MEIGIENISAFQQKLVEEIKNFEEIAHHLKPEPGEIPHLPGIDVHGESIPYNGVIGGDHIIYVDFNRRYDLEARIKQMVQAGNMAVAEELGNNRNRAGILIADVSGHRITDAALTAMLHQAFLLGVQYELEIYGTITPKLFDNINTRFYNSSVVGKFITMIYGEISTDGTFRFISAAHPHPIVFSREFQRIMDISTERLITFPPIGTMPSRDDLDVRHYLSPLGQKDSYTINEIKIMGYGDILLLYSDGFCDHTNSAQEPYFPSRLEIQLRELSEQPADVICHRLREDLLSFGKPADDISYVVIKKTN